MYKSPIEIICGDIQKQMDNDIYRVTQKYDIKVDKNELIQALQYDRDQYEKGYADGNRDAMDSIVRCKDCTHYRKSEHNSFDGINFCYVLKDCNKTNIGFIRNDNDFCSRGERRTDG